MVVGRVRMYWDAKADSEGLTGGSSYSLAAPTGTRVPIMIYGWSTAHPAGMRMYGVIATQQYPRMRRSSGVREVVSSLESKR